MCHVVMFFCSIKINKPFVETSIQRLYFWILLFYCSNCDHLAIVEWINKIKWLHCSRIQFFKSENKNSRKYLWELFAGNWIILNFKVQKQSVKWAKNCSTTWNFALNFEKFLTEYAQNTHILSVTQFFSTVVLSIDGNKNPFDRNGRSGGVLRLLPFLSFCWSKIHDVSNFRKVKWYLIIIANNCNYRVRMILLIRCWCSNFLYVSQRKGTVIKCHDILKVR